MWTTGRSRSYDAGRRASPPTLDVEVQAAAKAITMLADDLEAARSQLMEERMIREALESRLADDEAAEMERDLRTRLLAKLSRGKA